MMRLLLKLGWKNVLFNKKMVLLVSLYQLLWTFIIYYLVRYTISPLLRALPDESVSPTASHFYWLELKFLAAKTDLLLPYLIVALALMLLRMLLSPFLLSGLFGTLAHARGEQSPNQFIPQLKQHWKSFTLLYWIKTVLIFIPTLIVGLPIVKQLTTTYFSIDALSAQWLPLMLVVIWILCVRMISHGLFIGISSKQRWSYIVSTLLKRAFTLLVIFLIIAILSVIFQLIFQLAAAYMTGFIVSLLFFIMPVIQTFFKAWTISSHNIIFNE